MTTEHGDDDSTQPAASNNYTKIKRQKDGDLLLREEIFWVSSGLSLKSRPLAYAFSSSFLPTWQPDVHIHVIGVSKSTLRTRYVFTSGEPVDVDICQCHSCLG